MKTSHGRRVATFSQQHGSCPFRCLGVQGLWCSGVFRRVQGCSWGAHGVLMGCSWGAQGCAGVSRRCLSGVQGCSGVFRVHDILDGQKGDQGGPKMAKIHHGVKPDIFKTAPKMAKVLGGVKFQHLGLPLRPKKCFSQMKKGGRPKIDENFGWCETRISSRVRPKKRPKLTVGCNRTSLKLRQIPPLAFGEGERLPCNLGVGHTSGPPGFRQ